MDVFYDLPADLPQHQQTLLEAHTARVLTTWPTGTFVENLLVRRSGEIVVSVHSENRLEAVQLDGTHHTVARLPSSPTSLIEATEDLLVFGGSPGHSPAYLWRVKPNGTVTVCAEISEALFLNGSCPFLSGSALAVDSLLGKIFLINLQEGHAAVWFSHELLTKITDFPLMPGGNGLRIFRNFVYVSNTDRALVVRIPIQSDGSAGAIEVVAENLRADDFIFDTEGFAYLTTHIENTLIRLSPEGKRIAIAGADQGMPGSTAVRFGRTAATQHTLFVTTTGGLIAPYEGVVQEAKLVMVEVEAEGYPIDYLEAVK